VLEKMKVLYDFEFKEYKGNLDVISGGFIREDGKTLYFVLNDFDTLAVIQDWWLMRNVMCSIGHESYVSHMDYNGKPVKDMKITDEAAVNKQGARQLLLDFTADITPEWWAWYGAYDHVALCSLFGRMIDLPANWPMYTCDLKQLHKEKGYCEMPSQPEGKHNALEDAKFNLVRYNYLLEQPDSEKHKNNPIPVQPIILD
jgi:hypothetical protein